ncbi:hypothetical protein JMJ77_0015233 [Colletotrichum scovillei]|uniref:Uncharacterized protein n=1 Tax=Colletotrichum scovillei TaxID=1209932 RepID=A0A9P7R022_9PEZI|nr:hypothetical protein JMJ77_0015233 [Colletotrichum scovillei]KAG7056888.1 hypothetical protein JMJ78_0000678 [Colletotrichum scovillei]KAG7066786.1 hypothetical protein JMJ76_0000637 [Colletotrichum scovillei]
MQQITKSKVSYLQLDGFRYSMILPIPPHDPTQHLNSLQIANKMTTLCTNALSVTSTLPNTLAEQGDGLGCHPIPSKDPVMETTERIQCPHRRMHVPDFSPLFA